MTGFIQDEMLAQEPPVDPGTEAAIAEAVAATEPKHGKRFWDVWIIVLTVLLLIGGGLVWLGFHTQNSKISSQSKALTVQSTQINQQQAQLDAEAAARAAAVKQLQEHGIQPTGAATASVPTPVPGPEGAQGPGPSNAQVANAVASYCAANNNCTPNGPSMAQVAAAVSQYCDANGKCAGPSGVQGVQGVQGPGPSSSQIASAVSSYCANNNNCSGPTGPTGPAGTNGTNGLNGSNAPTITAVTENQAAGVCTITLTLSDATTVTGAIHGTLTCP